MMEALQMLMVVAGIAWVLYTQLSGAGGHASPGSDDTERPGGGSDGGADSGGDGGGDSWFGGGDSGGDGGSGDGGG